jgi:hypothetical protein
MFSLATIKALQIYGIAIVISMAVAVLIKVLVVLTSRVKRVATVAAVTQKTAAAPVAKAGIPDDVVAALSAAIAVIAGPHRILHIGESKRSWANEGRIAQHSHQPRH